MRGNIFFVLVGALLLFGCPSQPEEPPPANHGFMDAYSALNGTYLQNRSSMGPEEVLANVKAMEAELAALGSEGYNTTYEAGLYAQMMKELRMPEIIGRENTEEHGMIRQEYGNYLGATSENYFAVDWDSVLLIPQRMQAQADILSQRGYDTSLEEALITRVRQRAETCRDVFQERLGGIKCDGSEGEIKEMEEALWTLDAEHMRLEYLDNATSEELQREFGYSKEREMDLNFNYSILIIDQIVFSGDPAGFEGQPEFWIYGLEEEAECSDGHISQIILDIDDRFICPVADLYYDIEVADEITVDYTYSKDIKLVDYRLRVGEVIPDPHHRTEVVLDSSILGVALNCSNYKIIVYSTDAERGVSLDADMVRMDDFPGG